MHQRMIVTEEVEEAHRNARVQTPGQTANEVNLWGLTTQGRRPRITVRAGDREFVISVVAPDEEL
jgi:hypothetical protein